MRLIDADALLENYNLKNMHKYNADGSLNRQATNTLMLYEIADMIEDAPTAYDMNKVVETIKKSPSDRDGLRIFDGDEPMIRKDMAIEIVKKGGIK